MNEAVKMKFNSLPKVNLSTWAPLNRADHLDCAIGHCQ